MKFRVTETVRIDQAAAEASKGRLASGAVYLAGDEIDVNRREANALLDLAPGNFEPVDESAVALVEFRNQES